MGKDTSKEPKDLPETVEEEPTNTEEPEAPIEPEPSEEKEEVVPASRLKGMQTALKKSREREKALEQELVEARKSGMSEKEATKYELETLKQRNTELESAIKYYEAEKAKTEILKGYKHASQFSELLYGTPEEMKEQADKMEKYIEEQTSGGEGEPTPPPVDLDNPPLEGKEVEDEEFGKLSVEEMRKRLPVKK